MSNHDTELLAADAETLRAYAAQHLVEYGDADDLIEVSLAVLWHIHAIIRVPVSPELVDAMRAALNRVSAVLDGDVSR